MGLKEREKLFLATLSGLMLTASFPPGDAGWMAWFALLPLLFSLNRTPPSGAFRLGFVAGMAHYLTLVYWVIVAMSHYGGLNLVISTSVMVLLCLYLSLYPAFFSYLCVLFEAKRFFAFQMAAVWVLLEYLRGKLLTGFPWCLLGYTQYSFTDLIQVADLVGVYGLSFVIVALNGFVHSVGFRGAAVRKVTLTWELPLVFAMFLFVFLYGDYRLSENRPEEKEGPILKVAIVQGNIDQSVKWNPEYQRKTLEVYERLSLSARPSAPDLLVWPETAVPFFFQEGNELARKVLEIWEEIGADFIFGSPAYEREENAVRYYNRVYLITSGPENMSYDKVHLVPFGEYVPLKKFLPFVNRLVPAAGDFAPGKGIEPLRSPLVSSGILICFEAIFPEIARQQVERGAQILVNVTNDAWFGRTSAPFQHLSMAAFRAVENGRPLVRAANTGISASIDPRGRIVQETALFREAVLSARVRLPGPKRTFYNRYGDIFVALVFAIMLIKLFLKLCYNRKLLD